MNLQGMLLILLSWAAHLSGYPLPAEPPVVQFQPHSFFVDQVCGGKECNAVGWYNDQGIIYIDQKYLDDDSDFVTSLLVHEMTHYLQHLSGQFDSLSCEDSVTREREAYRVQNAYIIEGRASSDLIFPAATSCGYYKTAGTAAAEAH